MSRLPVLLVVGLSGCMSLDPPRGDIIPPAVVRIEPQGEDVDVAAMVKVYFSEPVVPGSGPDRLVVLVPEVSVDGAFLQDLDSPPLASRRSDLLVDCRDELFFHDTRLTLDPVQHLAPATTYAVAVSAALCDRAGNPLVEDLHLDMGGRWTGTQTHVLHTFTTRAGADPEPVEQPDGGLPGDGNLAADGGADATDPGPDPVPVSGLLFTEIMANPAGTESEGEYVELTHMGDALADLTGCRLDDQGGAGTGDLLAPCTEGAPAIVAPGEVVLLVGQSFVAPADMQAGTKLFCTDRSTLTSRGLKNTGGEVLVFRDALGNEVDRYGGWVDFSDDEGCAATRIDIDEPDGEENWIISGGGECRSPGWVE